MRLSKVLGAAGLLLLAVVGLAWLNPFRWVGAGDLMSFTPFAVAAALALIMAAGFFAAPKVRRGWRWATWAASVCVGMVAVLSVMTGWFVLAFRDTDMRVAAVSPDGRFKLIVHETSNVIDPVEGLYVQSTDGPLSRRAYFGCFNHDATEPLEWARFTGPDTVTVKAEGQWTLRFDPDEVRAIDTLPDGMCAQGLYTG
ncbi:hypothetical protein [Actinomadura rugatobispora]|uniref:DUF1109 domain-containing protein n=1 Tax=Actinomadura rugatobispora TaxID=1994 RepID=A0ABW0ZVS9_9ACTN|nr:hypothetical protein GCM10010200_040480 [Actinomadura rugatobispora]